MRRSKRAFSFLEVLIGVIILAFGLVPLLWNLLQATQGTRVTVRQVQAVNHAANLLEALRAVPVKTLSRFPPCMVQIEGGDNVWRRPGETPEINFCTQEAYLAPGKEADKVFQDFVSDFFKEGEPIVPPLEPWFRRYFIILKDDETKPIYLTLIVRTEWNALTPVNGGGAKEAARHVELRTVVADPYAFGGTSAGVGASEDGRGSTGGGDAEGGRAGARPGDGDRSGSPPKGGGR